MKVTVAIFSDPKNGSEEALGRVFNGLASAYDFKQAGDEVSVVFQGAGTRWIGELTKKDHPAHELFEAVKDQVAGVSCGCADVFGGAEEAQKSGFDLIKNNPIPGTSGLNSFRTAVAEGSTVLTF
ncbi:DsrE family protein [Candidatus Nitronereus thalassa]|uniref:DsrE family protein n=1 Tax=Candidatus Nitronereus thalassa TaxID=3020898 RepID=A0ABU3KB10_9BACT|nr:DsrE family protein [Candidatus Nitronereus thalassa]MDT7043594.1 DsrE family protein [Candidatus Nitronereus thalassa]